MRPRDASAAFNLHGITASLTVARAGCVGAGAALATTRSVDPASAALPRTGGAPLTQNLHMQKRPRTTRIVCPAIGDTESRRNACNVAIPIVGADARWLSEAVVRGCRRRAAGSRLKGSDRRGGRLAPAPAVWSTASTLLLLCLLARESLLTAGLTCPSAAPECCIARAEGQPLPRRSGVARHIPMQSPDAA